MNKKLLIMSMTLCCALMCAAQKNGGSPQIGFWQTDSDGLPSFKYTGSLPYSASIDGDSVKLDPDPWFLLGNYQMTLFAHVSGQYELITGQRAWGRMNQGKRPNTGVNAAKLEVIAPDGKTVENYALTGLNSVCADPKKSSRVVGCGFARYDYKIGKFAASRTINILPSKTIDGGQAAFRLTVKIKNQTGKTQRVRFTESILAQYETMMQQSTPKEYRKVKYTPQISVKGDAVVASFKVATDDPMLFLSKDNVCKYEGYPPSLYIKDLTSLAKPTFSGDDMALVYDLTLKNKEEKTLEIIVGFDMDRPYSNMEKDVRELSGNIDFRKEWLDVLPDFKDEIDPDFRRELVWHAHTLEAMATFSDYYRETKIPQGCIYDYYWGQHASARDNFQHALPTIYYNPKLTKSIIRYMLQRTRENGEIMLIEYGNGYAEPTCYQTSDQQLWFFLLLSEYLRITKDYAFLNEKVACYPVKDMPKYTILEHARHCFDYFRNYVGAGRHGLVRLMNSDWNDGIYYSIESAYNFAQPQGESHMNTAMALTILPSLAEQLQKGGAPDYLIESIKRWRKSLYDAYMNDWGSRTFPRRMYFAGRSFGENSLWLDHCGFTLMATDIDLNKRKQLYQEMCNRLYVNEKLGAREQEKPEITSNDIEYGSRENGGFWYSLNAPVILGLATFDKPEAEKRLRQMSMINAAKEFPKYWSGYWSASDNIESSLMKTEGLTDQTGNYSEIAIACAHLHAWMVYCWNRLRE